MKHNSTTSYFYPSPSSLAPYTMEVTTDTNLLTHISPTKIKT
jgi:hypothetical protein